MLRQRIVVHVLVMTRLRFQHLVIPYIEAIRQLAIQTDVILPNVHELPFPIV